MWKHIRCSVSLLDNIIEITHVDYTIGWQSSLATEQHLALTQSLISVVIISKHRILLLAGQSQIGHQIVNIFIVRMFCPTAVDQFFATKMADLELSKNNNRNKSYKQAVGLQERIKEAEEKRRR